MNTIYTPLSVVKKYCEDNDFEINAISNLSQSPEFISVFLAPNESETAKIVCLQTSPTQFLLWTYGNDYAQKVATSFDFSDVNTPPLETSRAYDV